MKKWRVCVCTITLDSRSAISAFETMTDLLLCDDLHNCLQIFKYTFWVSVQSIFYILWILEILCFKCFLVEFSLWRWPGLLWAWWYTGCTWVFLLKGQLVWIQPLVLPKYSLVVDSTLGIAWVLFFLSAQFCMICAYPCHSRRFFLLISEQKRVQVRSLDSSTLWTLLDATCLWEVHLNSQNFF